MSGMILPADSPLVQFEVLRNGDGTPAPENIGAVWIDPTKPEPRDPLGQYGHCCNGPFFRVMDRDISTEAGYRPVICLCMGRFIE